MTIQPSTFRPLPRREKLQAAIQQQREHIADLTGYLCYLIPLAAACGDRVYDIAAETLAGDGLDVDAPRLRRLAGELSAAGSEARYRRARLRHTALFVTYCKDTAGTFSAD